MRQRCGASPKKHSPLVCANGAVHRKNHSPLVCANGAVHRQKNILHWYAPTARCIAKTILHWYAPTARCIAKTAEVRFNMLARGWLAYPVTPMHTQLPPKSGCRNAIATYIVAERRHFSVTRYAERSGCVPGFCASFKSRVPEVRHYLWRDG